MIKNGKDTNCDALESVVLPYCKIQPLHCPLCGKYAIFKLFFSLPFREVRECLKLDQDHKDCFPFYKVKQHFPSLCQIDLTLTIPAPFQELKLLFGIHPSTPNSNGDVISPHNIHLKLKRFVMRIKKNIIWGILAKKTPHCLPGPRSRTPR